MRERRVLIVGTERKWLISIVVALLAPGCEGPVGVQQGQQGRMGRQARKAHRGPGDHKAVLAR